MSFRPSQNFLPRISLPSSKTLNVNLNKQNYLRNLYFKLPAAALFQLPTTGAKLGVNFTTKTSNFCFKNEKFITCSIFYQRSIPVKKNQGPTQNTFSASPTTEVRSFLTFVLLVAVKKSLQHGSIECPHPSGCHVTAAVFRDELKADRAYKDVRKFVRIFEKKFWSGSKVTHGNIRLSS